MSVFYWLRERPFWLYGITTALLLPYLALAFVYPTGVQGEDVFFLPALLIGQVNLLIYVIAVGYVLAAVFYTRKTGSQSRGYLLFAVTAIWLLGVISLAQSTRIMDGVVVEDTLAFDGRTYHLALTTTPVICDEQTCTADYILYECEMRGWFCNVAARNITAEAGRTYLRETGTALQVAQFDGVVVHQERDWVCGLPLVCETDPVYARLAS